MNVPENARSGPEDRPDDEFVTATALDLSARRRRLHIAHDRADGLEPVGDLVPRFFAYLARTATTADARSEFARLACHYAPDCEDEAA